MPDENGYTRIEVDWKKHLDLKASFEFRVSHTVDQINQILSKRSSDMHLCALQWAEWSLLVWSYRILKNNLETPYFCLDLTLVDRQLKALEEYLDQFRTSILTSEQSRKLLKYLHSPKLD